MVTRELIEMTAWMWVAQKKYHYHLMERGPSYKRSSFVKMQLHKSSLCGTDRCIKVGFDR